MRNQRGIAALLSAYAFATGYGLQGATKVVVDFNTDIRPILSKNCFACHGPDEAARQANFRIDTREHAGGETGGHPGIVPGKAEESRVYLRITHPDTPMPPSGERLQPEEIQLIKTWIEQGAPYERHWAFVKPERPEPPEVSNDDWVRNEIDRFVLARLAKEGLEPFAQADKYTLIRRLALDLTGLPPTPEQVEAFTREPPPAEDSEGREAEEASESDESEEEAAEEAAEAKEKPEPPLTYEQLVVELLNSPHYGERWARVWLDLARHADSKGYEKDPPRTMWPYRDWVIRALNANMPYDRFTVLQLAGDLLPVPTQEQLVATGFHRNTMTNTEGGTDDEEFRDLAVKDRVATTGQVWMGLTFGCAQCHTHKYDPIPQKEFYQLYAFFNQSEDHDQNDDRPTLDLGDNVTTLVMRDLAGDKRRTTHIHERGSFLSKGPEVQPAVLTAFHSLPEHAPPNRLGLAKWIVDKRNPLTARVMVNRLWGKLFGAGFVETEEDFGAQGSPPTHPELLDWLATEFMRLDWDIKAILKTMVMSATYRQSSEVTAELAERDPRNRLLARGPRVRLEAEMVRDQALAVSGLLSRGMYGPPVMPWQPDGVWQIVNDGVTRWETSPGEDRYRRALYTLWRRSAPYPSMLAYDAPTREVCTMRRIRTNTPLQALASLNDPVSVEAAQHLALRMLERAGPSPQERARHAFQMTLIRPPGSEEVERLVGLHAVAKAKLKNDPRRARELLHYDRTLYKDGRLATLVDDSRGAGATWRYSTQEPPDNWASPGFDDSNWRTGSGTFGPIEEKKGGNKDIEVVTDWTTEKIWMRIDFDVPREGLTDYQLEARYQCAFDAFVNGVHAAHPPQGYGIHTEIPLYPDAAAAIKPGRNVVAVAARRNTEKSLGRHIDVGLKALKRPDLGSPAEDDADRAAWVIVANVLLNLDETLTKR